MATFCVGAVLVLAACGVQPAPSGTTLSSDEVRVSVDLDKAVALPDLVAAADVMGLELLTGAGEVTTVTSPASLQVASSMAAEGAQGRTLAELESQLGATGQERSKAMNALISTLQDLDGDPAVVQEEELPESAVVPDPNLRLVLQDAIVLTARWEQPFPAALTQPHPFMLPSGEGPTDLTPESLQAMQERLDAEDRRLVTLRMPVVDARSALDLTSYLTERAPSAMQGGFGGISEESLLISQAIQQGVLAVDEEGTVAAAVTEVAFADSGPAEPPIELTIDRPYLVRISDGRTGWALFFAHITDPRSEQ